MKTVEMDARTLAYIRVTGPMGKGMTPSATACTSGPRPALEGEWIFIYHDNP